LIIGPRFRADPLAASQRMRRASRASVRDGASAHHLPAVDLKVLSMLAAKKYLVDRAAPTASLERLKAQVEAYRVDNIER
jgi:hypothetical protein